MASYNVTRAKRELNSSSSKHCRSCRSCLKVKDFKTIVLNQIFQDTGKFVYT